jgi:hypothetical protein
LRRCFIGAADDADDDCFPAVPDFDEKIVLCLAVAAHFEKMARRGLRRRLSPLPTRSRANRSRKGQNCQIWRSPSAGRKLADRCVGIIHFTMHVDKGKVRLVKPAERDAFGGGRRFDDRRFDRRGPRRKRVRGVRHRAHRRIKTLSMQYPSWRAVQFGHPIDRVEVSHRAATAAAQSGTGCKHRFD